MKEPVREGPPEEIQNIEERIDAVLKTAYKWEDANKCDNGKKNYKGNFEEHMKKQKMRFQEIIDLLGEFKYYQNISLSNVTELEGKVKNLIVNELALDALVLKEKTKDFLVGKYPGFLESEAVGYLSMKSEHFPQFHYDNRAKLDSLHKEIISQKWKDKFPEKAIDEHGELVKKSYTELEHHICKLDKNSDEYKELKIQYDKAKEIGRIGIDEFTCEKSKEFRKDSSFSLPRPFASPINLRLEGSPKKSFSLGEAPKPEGSAYAFDADAAATLILVMSVVPKILNRLAKAMTRVEETSKRQQTRSQEAEAKPSTEPTGSKINPRQQCPSIN
jgi:hypothetical protein